MKNKLMPCIKLCLCFFAIVILSGCTGGREVNDLEIVVGLGVDKGDTPGTVKITAQVVKPGEIGKTTGDGGGGSGSNEKKTFINISRTGETIFDAVREMTHETGKRLFVSHSQVLIFGNEIAREGMQLYIDFFLRAHEMRPTTLILIAQNSASEVLDTPAEREKLPAFNISKLVNAYIYNSHTYKVNLQDFSLRMRSKTAAQIAPMVSIVEAEGKKAASVYGMAVFKNSKMVGTLTADETRGLLWVLGKVKSGIINISSPNGEGKIALEITGEKTKIKPEINGDKIIFNIEIKEESSLSEQNTTENMATLSAFESMQSAQADIIKKEIETAFAKSKELGSDIFGFGELLHKKYRSKWKEMEKNWDSIYPDIELNIKVETKIRKTDLLTKPVAPQEKR